MISIIIPNYNKGVYIEETIRCLLRQTYKNWEAIIVDDGSTDDSWAIIDRYAYEDRRITAVRTPEGSLGGAVARNKGIELAAGPYVIFLDSDDILTDTCLEYRLKNISGTDNDFQIYPGEIFFDYPGDTSSLSWKPKPSQKHLKMFLMHDLPWNVSMPIWKLEFLKKIGGFNLLLHRLQDVELHVRALVLNPKYFVFDNVDVDFYYRVSKIRNVFSEINMLEKYVDSLRIFFESVIRIYRSGGGDVMSVSSVKRWLKGTLVSIMLRVSILYEDQELNERQYFKFMKSIVQIGETLLGYNVWQKFFIDGVMRMRLLRYRGVARLSRFCLTHM